MNTDIRLSVDFFDHPKTMKLERRLGFAGIRSLQCLWIWAAKSRPDGDFSGMDAEDIEIAARWNGEEGKLVETLVTLGWLDEVESGYLLHDWEDHNAWAAEACDRSAKSRLGRLAQVNKKAFEECRRLGIESLSQSEYKKWKSYRPVDAGLMLGENSATAGELLANTGDRPATAGESLAPAPNPSPSPNPAPIANINTYCTSPAATAAFMQPKAKPKSKAEKEAEFAEAVVALFNRVLVDEQPEGRKLPKVTKVTPPRVTLVKARAKACPELKQLAGWEAYFQLVSRCPYLMGEVNDWIARFDWLLQVGNFIKVREGNYLPRDAAGSKGGGGSAKLPELDRVKQYARQYGEEGVVGVCKKFGFDPAVYMKACSAELGAR